MFGLSFLLHFCAEHFLTGLYAAASGALILATNSMVTKP